MSRWSKITLFIFSFCLFSITWVHGANATTTSSRLAGNDRYLTAIAVSQSGWPDGAATVVFTTGENYPDALSAAPLAGKYNAPLLLVGSSGLSPETLSELKRLNAKKAYLVGGTGVIPKSVESQLSLAGISMVRLAGNDRYDTALAVARVVGTSQGIFVTSGQEFADALSVAPIASGKGMPILLAPEQDLTSNEKTFLAKSKLKRTIIVGGEAEVPMSIQNQLPAPERIDGADAYERNVALLKYFGDSINLATTYVATGEDFPDALSAAALAQKDKNALVLVKGNQIPSTTKTYLAQKVIGQIQVFGGEGVIPYTTESSLIGLPALILKVTNLTVTVQEKQTFSLPKTVTIQTGQGDWQEVPVDWDLASVSTQKAGTYTYSGTVSGYSGKVVLTLIVEALPSKADTLTAEVIQGSSYSLPNTVKVTMSDNSIKEFPVTWTTSPTVSILSKVGTYTFQGTVDGTSLKVSFNLKVSEDAAITFKDSNLVWAIKYALGKQSSAQPIYRSDVLSITSLDAKGNGIRDLTGMEAFTNLTTLNLGNNYLKGANLAPLQKLTNLKSLNLSYNSLEQVTSLKSLTSLNSLDISYNYILDLAPLRSLTRLETLYLKGNSSLDYSATRLYYNQLTKKDFFLE
ncbi:cell wall-binding repeat-containing protein [Desulfitobacterium sp. Sab5]|uniref:cell wall-binding repeat-containing protein n=1 Tax=Desulfitobacterium nosdiversum TaxID=3375356 RepID=UPI003CEC604D